MPSPPALPCNVFCTVDHWASVHEGLGGWAAATFSVLAIFAAWLLARQEYRRGERKAKSDQDALKATILKAVLHFDELCKPFTDSLENGNWLTSFESSTLNDPARHMMIDLAHVPVTSWPSLVVYTAFKQYWFAQLQLERIVLQPGSSAAILKPYIDQREGSLQALERHLSTSGFRGGRSNTRFPGAAKLRRPKL